jgi:FAD-binding 9 siderophore-interacting domain protein
MDPVNTLPPPEALRPERVRNELRFRRLQVRRTESLSPAFVRISLDGEALAGFASRGFDDHMKLFFPDPDTGELLLPTLDERGMPVRVEGQRYVARDYTPRHFDTQAGTLTIDFAVHEAGPATQWARRARPGDVLGVGGPRGSMVIPAGYDWMLLMGDETALPAIGRRLEELPSGQQAIVVAETGSPADRVPLQTGPDVTVHWCYRGVEQPAGQSAPLLAALRNISLPTRGQGFVWGAGEGSVMREVRAWLMSAHGLHPKRIRVSAYWKLGSAAAHEDIED